MALLISSYRMGVKGASNDWLIWTPTLRFSAHQRSLWEKHNLFFLAATTENISANTSFKVGGESPKKMFPYFIFHFDLKPYHPIYNPTDILPIPESSSDLEWAPTVCRAPVFIRGWSLRCPIGLGWSCQSLCIPWPTLAAHPSAHSDWFKGEGTSQFIYEICFVDREGKILSFV